MNDKIINIEQIKGPFEEAVVFVGAGSTDSMMYVNLETEEPLILS